MLDWLQYMGVVSDVLTLDKGKLGHELRVSVGEGGILCDLTHVGVGVSQVVPIVVSALLADEGSTLIFEQPELHLHPRVQSRLADFFLSMAHLQKQCIIETHSEHLIDRLRLRAAASEDESVANGIKICFVEAVNGHSKYTPLEVTQYGTIKNWPRGFFDESEESASQLLRARMEKRSRQRASR